MYKKINDISEEERAEFRQAMEDVIPIDPSQLEIQTALPTLMTLKNKKTTVHDEPMRYPISASNVIKEVSGEEIMSFHHSGLQRKLLLQLRRGKFIIEATLDLHTYTLDLALTKTNEFLSYCQARNLKWVCIIHGKSLGNTPVIKNALNHYLRHQPVVLAFHSAMPKDGGTGALYLLLKKNY